MMMQQMITVSVKDWQLKLPLKEIPDFVANERQTDSAEKEMPGLNVTEQDIGNNRQLSLLLFQLCSIQAKMQKSHVSMATLDIS